jgi:hypothetical protein
MSTCAFQVSQYFHLPDVIILGISFGFAINWILFAQGQAKKQRFVTLLLRSHRRPDKGSREYKVQFSGHSGLAFSATGIVCFGKIC